MLQGTVHRVVGPLGILALRLLLVSLAHQHRVPPFRLAAAEVAALMDRLIHLQGVQGPVSLVVLAGEVVTIIRAVLQTAASLGGLEALDVEFLAALSALAIRVDREKVGLEEFSSYLFLGT